MALSRVEVLEMLANGEGSGVEFKRDDIENHRLAKELVAFANFAGGVVLLGVEDDGTVSGTQRPDLEEWVAELCRVKIQPPLIPYFQWFHEFEPGKDVAAVQVLAGPDNPYALVHSGRRSFPIRVGSTNREASMEELERLFQAAGRISYGLKPVPGAGLGDLDRRRLENYFGNVLGGAGPAEDSEEEWTRLLVNIEFMVDADGRTTPTVDGMLLFGRDPGRYLPQSGIRALAYTGTTPDYAAQADEDLRGPLTPLLDNQGELIEAGSVEQALAFVARNAAPTARIDEGRRIDRPRFPADVLRETLVNALVHRDYSITGTDVTLEIFADRLEITSPGRLPNTVTVDGLRAGARYARNQMLVNVMRDLGYVDFRGMGVRTKIIPGMLAHNGTEPEFTETESSFKVCLWG